MPRAERQDISIVTSSFPGMAEDDSDIRLQRESGEIIDGIKLAIRYFLFKGEALGLEGFPKHVRRNVKVDKTRLLAHQLDGFQESPQLLDPHLEYLLSHLLHAFGGYIRCSVLYQTSSDIDAGIEPLPRAICKLVYTLCKVRGAKVITRFFDNDTRYLGRLSDILETQKETLSWEERYVILLWLSHLALTPFDLDSLSTFSAKVHSFEPILTLQKPLSLPNVADRLLSLALRSLSSVSKEREAATLLLVRLSLRPDMQQLDLHKHCIDWALRCLRKSAARVGTTISVHSCIGVLSFLANFFKAGDSANVGQLVLPMIARLQTLLENPGSNSELMFESAVARKLNIKLERTLALHLLSGSSLLDSQTNQLDQLIDHLLFSLADKDYPVRFATSKALSVIAQKLDTNMKMQLVDEIITRYDESTNSTAFKDHESGSHSYAESRSRKYAGVDALHWHGLTLTLAHLLYRHSVPRKKLTAVVDLVYGTLDFEQRSAGGKSTGANVRDAACFAIWSLARRYTTRELLIVAASGIRKRDIPRTYTSLIEVLAAGLVVTATLDPEGNVRRAASAALQELVGRHPEEVPKGIDLVQVVDYHAVGSQHQALYDVASAAAALHQLYSYGYREELLGWRGLYSPDAQTRRHIAIKIGQLVQANGSSIISPLQQHIETSQERPVREWHGLYLALAAATTSDTAAVQYGQAILSEKRNSANLPFSLNERTGLSKTNMSASGECPELAAEAFCQMITAFSFVQPKYLEKKLLKRDVSYHNSLLYAALQHCDKVLPHVFSRAAQSIFSMIQPEVQLDLVVEWLENIHNGHGGRVKSGAPNAGWIIVVGALLLDPDHVPDEILLPGKLPERVHNLYRGTLIKLLGKESENVSKIAALKHLYRPVYIECQSARDSISDMQLLEQALIAAMDDYTVDARGDIGSNVRIAAVEVLGQLQPLGAFATQDEIIQSKVSGLRLEKLDKVRNAARYCHHAEWEAEKVSSVGS
ncbi:MAG: hypothetical protein Q9218_007116, partial [Villophora microphyllina]